MLLTWAFLLAAGAAPLPPWLNLAEGVEYAQLPLGDAGGKGPAVVHTVRIDPARAELTVALASEQKGPPRTAAEWSRSRNLLAAINAGMYAKDIRTNVGFLRDGE